MLLKNKEDLELNNIDEQDGVDSEDLEKNRIKDLIKSFEFEEMELEERINPLPDGALEFVLDIRDITAGSNNKLETKGSTASNDDNLELKDITSSNDDKFAKKNHRKQKGSKQNSIPKFVLNIENESVDEKNHPTEKAVDQKNTAPDTVDTPNTPLETLESKQSENKKNKESKKSKESKKNSENTVKIIDNTAQTLEKEENSDVISEIEKVEEVEVVKGELSISAPKQPLFSGFRQALGGIFRQGSLLEFLRNSFGRKKAHKDAEIKLIGVPTSEAKFEDIFDNGDEWSDLIHSYMKIIVEISSGLDVHRFLSNSSNDIAQAKVIDGAIYINCVAAAHIYNIAMDELKKERLSIAKSGLKLICLSSIDQAHVNMAIKVLKDNKMCPEDELQNIVAKTIEKEEALINIIKQMKGRVLDVN